MLHFKHKEQVIDNRLVIKLDIAHNGHMLLQIKTPKNDLTGEENSVCVQTSSGKLEMAKNTIRKLHIQLSHLGYHSFKRIAETAGYLIKDQWINEILSECGCVGRNISIRKPIAEKYVPPYCGRAIFPDVFYPSDRNIRRC